MLFFGFNVFGENMLKSFVPEMFLSLKDYNRNKFSKDIVAGIIVGIIALPLSIALSIASGAGPEAGLITAIFAGAAAAIFGGSKTQITGPTGAFVVIVSGIITNYGYKGLLLATLMSGIITVALGLLRSGKIIKYIPLSVIEGFTAGIAATIFIGQLNDFFGLDLKGLSSESFAKLLGIIKGFSAFNISAFILGTIAVAIILLVPKISKKLPAAFIAIIICTLLNTFFGCTTLGDLYGKVSVNIAFSASFIDFSMIKELIIPAITISLLASIESLLSAVVADGMAGTKHNPDNELIGQGIANIISPLFGGLPATGAIARTSANIKNGGQTPVSALVHCLMVLLLGFVLMPLAVYIPMTVFAAILIVVCKNMLNLKEINKIAKTTCADAVLMALTFILTVVFNLVVAICINTALALVIEAVKYFKHRHIGGSVLLDNIFKLEGILSYVNCKKLFDNKKTDKQVVFDMENVKSMDADAVNLLIECARKKEISYIKISDEKLANMLKKHREIEKLIAS
jgi:SulP family sulfate permease